MTLISFAYLKANPAFLSLAVYSLRWNIETAYYEQKTFWSKEHGEAIAKPIVIAPNEGYTQTFIGIGSFDDSTQTKNRAKNICSYLSKSKFVRLYKSGQPSVKRSSSGAAAD